MSEIPLIAVVDDDEAIREAIQSLLRSVGLRAAVFASAEDFLHSESAAGHGLPDRRRADAADERPGAPAAVGHRQLSHADHLHHGPWR